jgi:hypothetical protein
VAELEQFPLHSAVSPARVLRRHPYDQRRDDVVDRWASGPIRVGPLLAHESVMPAQDRVRGDQAMATQRSWQPRTSAANTARSAHSRRGFGLVRRSTATSWRRTSSSTSLVADVRPSSRSSPSTCWKIRCNILNDTAEIMHGRCRSPITAGQRHVQHCGTPQGQFPCRVPELGAGSLTSGDCCSDMITACRCGCSI